MSNIKKLVLMAGVLLFLVPGNMLFAQESEYEIDELSLESVDDLGNTLDEIADEISDEIESLLEDEIDLIEETEDESIEETSDFEIDEVIEISDDDEVEEINETDEIAVDDESDEIEEISEEDEIDEVDEIEEVDEVDEVEEITEEDDIDEINDVEEITVDAEIEETEEIDEIDVIDETDEIEEIEINNEITSVNEVEEIDEVDEVIDVTEDIEEEKKGLFEPKWERDENLLGLDISLYLTNHNATAAMFEHESTNWGFGFSGEYVLPEEWLSFLPFTMPFDLGVLGRFEFEKPKIKNPAVEKWSILNFTIGAWTEIDFNTWLSIRPEIEFGTYMNIVKAPIRNVNGLYADFETQLVGSFRFYPEYFKQWNVGFEAAPVITWVLEKKHAPLYLGLRLGVVYSIDKRGIIYPITSAIDKKNEDKLLAQQEQERLEAERLAAEEAARLAAEEEAARIAAEEEAARIAAEEEAARLAAEEEAARLAAEEEAARLAAEEEAARLAAEEEAARLAAEEEAARLAAEEEAKKEVKVAKSVAVRENDDGTVEIDIPTLAFKSNSPELTNVASNIDSINKVADILLNEDYIEYECTIIGYVNPDAEIWTEEENQLALERAQTVVNELVKRGVEADRLTALHGEGRTENKEYNRRVEFKLTK